MHNCMQKELLENINAQLELDPTVEYNKKSFYLFLLGILEFPPMWGDPWTPDWKRKKKDLLNI